MRSQNQISQQQVQQQNQAYRYSTGPSKVQGNPQYQGLRSQQALRQPGLLYPKQAQAVQQQLQLQKMSKSMNKPNPVQGPPPRYHEYLVTCRILEAQLSKDQSTFLSSMNVYCEVRFESNQIQFGANQKGIWDAESRAFEMDEIVQVKQSSTQTGQNPKWSLSQKQGDGENESDNHSQFSFNYQKLTKHGQRSLAMQRNIRKLNEISNRQQIDITLFKKTIYFTSDKIGQTNIQLHNATSGIQSYWLVLTNIQDEVVGKLLVQIEIKRDVTTRKIRQIKQDLKMCQNEQVRQMQSRDIGMTKDMTEDRGMPLRNHEQVLLLNERSEPQSNHQSNVPTNQMVSSMAQSLTQATQITHQTQNSALALGGVLATTKSPNQSTSQQAGPSVGQPNRQTTYTQNSQMGATSITHVHFSPNDMMAIGTHLDPLYLETTKIIPNNTKHQNNMLLEGMNGNNHTVNHKEDEDDDEYYDEEDEEYDDYYYYQQQENNHNGRIVHGDVSEDAVLNDVVNKVNSKLPEAGDISGMGLLGIGVIATQNIREEDSDEEYEQYGAELDIGIVEETPPVVEGGGPSTGVRNTNGRNTGGGGSQQSHQMQGHQTRPWRIGNPHPRHNLQEEDDESNINSDEQNEYLSEAKNRNQSYQIMQQDMLSGNQNQIQRNNFVGTRPGTSTQNYQRKTNQQQRIFQSSSAMNVRTDPNNVMRPTKQQQDYMKRMQMGGNYNSQHLQTSQSQQKINSLTKSRSVIRNHNRSQQRNFPTQIERYHHTDMDDQIPPRAPVPRQNISKKQINVNAVQADTQLRSNPNGVIRRNKHGISATPGAGSMHGGPIPLGLQPQSTKYNVRRSNLQNQQIVQVRGPRPNSQIRKNYRGNKIQQSEFQNLDMDIDDQDLVQDSDQGYGEDEDSEQYAVNSEGDEEKYSRVGGGLQDVNSPYPVQTRKYKEQKQGLSRSQKGRRQPSQEAILLGTRMPAPATNGMQSQNIENQALPGYLGGVHHGTHATTGTIGTNPLEQETFSMQQDTFQNMDHTDQNLHQMGSIIEQKHAQIQQKKATRPHTSHTQQHTQSNLNKNKLNINGSLISNIHQGNDQSVIQHITSHSHSNSSESEHQNWGTMEDKGRAYRHRKNRDSIQIGGGTLQNTTNQNTLDERKQMHSGPRKYGEMQIIEDKSQSLIQQYNTYQEYEDFMNQSQNRAEDQQEGAVLSTYVKQNKLIQQQRSTDQNSVNFTKTDGEGEFDFDAISQMNNRAWSQEMKLNQMKQTVAKQFEKIQRDKEYARSRKEKLKKDLQQLKHNQKKLEQDRLDLEKEKFEVKNQKLMLDGQLAKARVLRKQFKGLIQGQEKQQSQVEIMSQLKSIKVILDLLRNDNKTAHSDDDKESGNSSSEEEKQASENGLQKSNAKNEPTQSSQLDHLCKSYQNKLDEMNTMFASMQNQQRVQNLQLMDNEMKNKMNQINQFQAYIQTQQDNQYTQQQFFGSNMQMISASATQSIKSQPYQGQPSPALILHSPNAQLQPQADLVKLSITQQQTLQQTPLVPPYEIQQQNTDAEKRKEETHSPPLQKEESQDDIPCLQVSPEPNQIRGAQQVIGPVEAEEQKDEADSSTSEFVPNYDPDFLCNINSNIRAHNVQQAEDDLSEEQGHEEDIQRLNAESRAEEDEQAEMREAQRLLDQYYHPYQVEEQKAMVDPKEEVISDCASFEEIAQHTPEQHLEQNSDDYQQMFDQSVVQGTQGDFMREDQRDQQEENMAVFQSIQQKLKRIGGVQQHQSQTTIEEVQQEEEMTQAEEEEKRIDDHMSARQPQQDDEEDYYDEQASVVYSQGGTNVYDQPQRAVYGIKPAPNQF